MLNFQVKLTGQFWVGSIGYEDCDALVTFVSNSRAALEKTLSHAIRSEQADRVDACDADGHPANRIIPCDECKISMWNTGPFWETLDERNNGGMIVDRDDADKLADENTIHTVALQSH